MPLPEIPESWSKFVNTILLAVIAVLAALGYSKTNRIEDQQVVGHQKMDVIHEKQAENSAKIDAAKVAADSAKTTVATNTAVTDAKLDELKKTMTSLPPAVAQEVKRDKDK